jgi:hypothetical protein
MYYQKTEFPTFLPLALYIPGGNRKTTDPTRKLPGRIERDGVIYPLERNSPAYFKHLRNKKQ